MKVLRRTLAMPKREELWQWVDAVRMQVARMPEVEDQAAASALTVLSTWQGTRRGSALEILYVVVFGLIEALALVLPRFRTARVVHLWCDKPPHRLYAIKWLFWALVIGPTVCHACDEAEALSQSECMQCAHGVPQATAAPGMVTLHEHYEEVDAARRCSACGLTYRDHRLAWEYRPPNEAGPSLRRTCTGGLVRIR